MSVPGEFVVRWFRVINLSVFLRIPRRNVTVSRVTSDGTVSDGVEVHRQVDARRVSHEPFKLY